MLNLKDVFFSLTGCSQSVYVCFQMDISRRWIQWIACLNTITPSIQELLPSMMKHSTRTWLVLTSLPPTSAYYDLLIAAATMEACRAVTKGLFRTLGELGYSVSAKKAQLSKAEVTYLGSILKGTKDDCQKQGKRPYKNVQTQQLPRVC